MSTFWTTFFSCLIICFCTSVAKRSIPDVFYQPNFLNVPFLHFEHTIVSATVVLQQAVAVVSDFSNIEQDFRLNSALISCLHLFDLTSENLRKSLSVVEYPRGENVGTGDLSSDLTTWFSAALTNQETCLQELDNVKSLYDKEDVARKRADAKEAVERSLYKAQLLVRELLSMVRRVPTDKPNGVTLEKPKPMVTLLHFMNIKPDVTVAADGSGKFRTVGDAINSAPHGSSSSYVIRIKKGIYKENIRVDKTQQNLMLIGDGMGLTVITGSRGNSSGWNTFDSATVGVDGANFVAAGITFENTAGSNAGQAVALRTSSDLSVLYRCEIKGYQDTLYAHSNRQFYRECRISGTIDFIFGDAAAVFQSCAILSRLGDHGEITITAQGREDPKRPTGFSFHLCNVTGESELMKAKKKTPTYLGRPWKAYARVVFMESFLDSIILPEGWAQWDQSFDSTVFYGEYKNTGPGANVARRIKWPGFHVITDPNVADGFTVSKFLNGNTWLPALGVPFQAGLRD